MNFDKLVKSLIMLDVAHKRLFTKPSTFAFELFVLAGIILVAGIEL